MVNHILLKVYEDLSGPHSYGGINGILHEAQKIDPNITRKNVINFLKSQPSYTLHKLTRKNFNRRKIVAPKPGVIGSTDLADMSLLSRYNNGYKYLLVFIDVFSRYAHVIPIKNKTGGVMATALKKILETEQFNRIRRLNSDEGKEYYNNKVQKVLEDKNIKLYSVSSREIKAAIAERFIRTLKSKIYKYMSHHNTQRYIDVLPQIIDSYNNTPHIGLKLHQTPNQVHNIKKIKDIERQFNLMYKSEGMKKKEIISPLTVGESVRIADEKRNWIFRRGYTIQNTLEIFKIKKIDKSQRPYAYYLEDLQGEDIKGIFYREELIPTRVPEFYQIDILKKRKVRGRYKYLVKWRGYPDTFNTWIDQDQITAI